MDSEFEFDQIEGFPNNPGSFETLDYRAKTILDFPWMLSFGQSYKRSLGYPLQRSMRFLMLPPFSHPVFGVSYSSVPLGSAKRRDKTKADAKSGLDLAYYLSGEVSWEGVMEGVHIQRLTPRLSIKNLIVTSFTLPSSLWMSSLRYAGNTYTSRLSYTTDKHILLFNVLKGISPCFSVGAEILYSVQEAKPGFSMGVRYSKKEGTTSNSETQFAASYSFMGHLKFTYTREVLPNLHMSMRYGLNGNNLQTNMAFGCERWPTSEFPFLVKAKFDSREGVGLSIGSHHAGSTWMFSMNYSKEGPLFGISFEL